MRWWSWMWFKQGQIEVDGGVGCDCDGDECGDKGQDGYAEKTYPATIPFPPPHPSLHPIPNQSKPIALTPSLSLL